MSDLPSLFLYLVVFGLSVGCIYLSSRAKNQTEKRALVVVGLLLPILLAAIRYNVGIDYAAYNEKMQDMQGLSFDQYSALYSTYSESSMYYLARLSSAIPTLSNIIFFGTYAAIPIIFGYLAIKRISLEKSKVWLGYMTYLFIFFPIVLNAMRQGSSVAILFFITSLLLTEKKISPNKIILVICLSLLAVWLHTSALSYIIILPFILALSRLHNISRLGFVSISTLLVIISILTMSSIDYLINEIPAFEKYQYFLDGKTAEFIKPTLVIQLLPTAIILFFYKRLRSISRIIPAVSVLVTLSPILFFTTTDIPQGYRLAYFYLPYGIVAYSYVASITSPKYKPLVTIGVILFCIAYFIFSNFIKNSYGLFPYQIILQGGL